MKSRPLPLIPLLLVCGFILLLAAGCGGDKKTAAPAAAPASAPAAKPAANAEETLAAIMMKSKQVPGFSCDVNVTGPGFSSTSKMWVDKKKMRMENTFEGKKMITIVDGDTTYMYDPATQTAMKFSDKDIPAGAEGKMDNPAEYEQTMVKDSVKFLETVMYEGVKCRVVAYTDKEDGATAKMWLREDYGLPMRQEVSAKSGEKMTIEYKNMKIGSQAADVFKLPAGVTIQDVGAMMRNQPKPGK
jgi:outer membrane lipoprotein-sorting protein